RAVWQRRFGAAPADPREAARQARFLAGRGYSAEVVRRVLRDAANERLTAPASAEDPQAEPDQFLPHGPPTD
ncbi:MAG: RecX family transcriptional regulator, partial [Ideonella sp.]|nr:RecX family transcriptional regulator [Ideonella sp.]